jgi:curved DNA-binding protein CbpA
LEVFLFLFNEAKKSHYETLGVAKNAGEGEIKRAYFGLVRKYQPDRFPEEFKEIRAAYETLGDREKRAKYDAAGSLPPSVAAAFQEAQRLDQFGRCAKAAELYQAILKKHPELDTVREHYAESLMRDDKPGKSGEMWEELCRRHPDNPRYARELGSAYFERGWNKKALDETRRALALDPGSMEGWSLFLSCTAALRKGKPNFFDEMQSLSVEALEAVKGVKTNEWEKIHLYAYAFITGGIENTDAAGGYLREIIRLIREGGRKGQDEGRFALKEIMRAIPAEALTAFCPEFEEMTDLLPDLDDELVFSKLDDIRLNLDIERLEEKKYSELFYDLFTILNSEIEDDEDELEVVAMEYVILNEKNLYAPQIRRLRTEFPELYALHASFFNEVLRTRDPEKLLYQRAKKYRKLKQELGVSYDEDEEEEEPDSAPTETVRRAQPKVGRNDPCPCGSGKKYKHCCGA